MYTGFLKHILTYLHTSVVIMVKYKSPASYYSLTHHTLIAMSLVCNLSVWSVYDSIFLLSCLIHFYSWYRGIKRASKLDLNISLISQFICEIFCHPNTINVQLHINSIKIQKRNTITIFTVYFYFYTVLFFEIRWQLFLCFFSIKKPVLIPAYYKLYLDNILPPY